MERHVFRTLLIYLTIVLAGIIILPTVGWMTLDDQARTHRQEIWELQDRERGLEEAGFFQRTSWAVRRWAEFDRDRVINLGLDLQGGIHMVVGFDMPEQSSLDERVMTEADVQEMVLQRIRNRVNDFEAKEPTIQKLGKNQVQIQLPGEKDIQRATDLIMRTAFLTFHMVSGPDETNNILIAIDNFSNNGFIPYLESAFGRGGGSFQVPEQNLQRVKEVIAEAEEAGGVIPDDKTIAFSDPPKPWETRGYYLYVMDKEAAMTGEGLKTAVARPNPSSPGAWQIIFEFDTDGARDFAEVTGSNIGRNMAIVLDESVVSAPNIEGRIFGTGNITGTFTANEAKDLAISLNSGSMPVKIREDYKGVVGASLGADSVRKGVRSSLIGVAFVMLFMAIYYRVGGIVANIALTANGLLVLGALAYFGATLTLPGIAGLILTIGMAVDANVLIFERIREELKNGKSLASSIEGGFARATVTILDANVTTLIAAAVLTQFGTGPVQGFAVTLSIGVCASVFSALIITRALLDFLSGRKIISGLVMRSIIKSEPKFQFLEKRKLAGMLSAGVIVVGLVVFGMRGADNFGVDFTNGTNMTVALNAVDPIEEGRIRDSLRAAGFDTPTVQEYKPDESTINQFIIRVGADDANATSEGVESVSVRVQRALAPLTGLLESELLDTEALNAAVDPLRVETVGPAVGKRLQKDAVAAISYALLFIVAYLWFRFEFKFAMGAVVALAHDVLITIGVFAVLGREITIPVVAALLTIIGYSLNDTIVVFDRIREDTKLYRGRGMSLAQIINASINQTLSRTILTSMTTLFVVVILFIFGGSAIQDFALALITGIVVGTYSSIFVASPVVYLWQQWRDKKSGPGGEHSDDDSDTSGRPRRRRRKKKRPDDTGGASPA